jgi:hypothetical protein
MQSDFLDIIRKQSTSPLSFVDEIATVLDISYDAAYRRIHNKTNLTFEEGIVLAKHFNVSLNKMFEVGKTNTYLTEITQNPHNEQELELWFERARNNVVPLVKLKNAEIIWSSLYIPIFRSLTNSYLMKYKLYVWLKDFNIEMAKSKISFDDWMKTIPDSLLQSAIALGNIYKNINISELWNEYTINGTLQQILYYFEAGLLSKNIALKICDDVHEVINNIERETIQQSIKDHKNEKFFRLYYNPSQNLNNTVMIVTPLQKAFFTPFSVLSYFKIEHEDACDMMYELLQKQMSNSKLLVTSGERDRTLFFKTLYQKISIAKERIEIDEKMSFL